MTRGEKPCHWNSLGLGLNWPGAFLNGISPGSTVSPGWRMKHREKALLWRDPARC